jgi:ribonuclease BN (tRNA processing enzyme)
MDTLTKTWILRIWPLCAVLGCTGSAAVPPRAPANAEGEPPKAALPCRPLDAASSRFALVVLGSGGPRSFGRASSGYAVLVDGKPRLLIDVGPGTFLRLGELDLDLDALDTVLLTHLHVDHAGELPGFVKARDLARNALTTFRIVGPDGDQLYPSTTRFVDRLFGAQGAFAYLPSFRSELRFAVTDLPTSASTGPQAVLEQDGIRVQAIAVDHGNVPAVAYRVEHAGRALVVSGDLASKDSRLAQLAAGADLLVYDTAVLDPPGSTESHYDLHTPPRRIGEVAAEAHVRSLLLSHLTGRTEDHAAEVLSSVQTTYRGEVRFAFDCMKIELAAP